jgi:hypothetical protein
MGLTATFFSEGNQWSITWKTDGAHKEKADYYGNKKDRTNEYASISDYRSESLPQKLLNHDKEFNIPFDISQNGVLLIAATGHST